jgi:hypothetical protein
MVVASRVFAARRVLVSFSPPTVDNDKLQPTLDIPPQSAFLVSACQDAGHRLPTGADPGARNSVAAREQASGPYGCFISQAVTGKPYPYSYSQFALEFPPRSTPG